MGADHEASEFGECEFLTFYVPLSGIPIPNNVDRTSHTNHSNTPGRRFASACYPTRFHLWKDVFLFGTDAHRVRVKSSDRTLVNHHHSPQRTSPARSAAPKPRGHPQQPRETFVREHAVALSTNHSPRFRLAQDLKHPGTMREMSVLTGLIPSQT